MDDGWMMISTMCLFWARSDPHKALLSLKSFICHSSLGGDTVVISNLQDEKTVLERGWVTHPRAHPLVKGHLKYQISQIPGFSASA